jgi:hypothetical protein
MRSYQSGNILAAGFEKKTSIGCGIGNIKRQHG